MDLPFSYYFYTSTVNTSKRQFYLIVQQIYLCPVLS
jgi:hypothetical protein